MRRYPSWRHSVSRSHRSTLLAARATPHAELCSHVTLDKRGAVRDTQGDASRLTAGVSYRRQERSHSGLVRAFAKRLWG